MGGASASPLRGGGRPARFGAPGGGERSRGDTGQRGASLRCSAVMGDFWGPTGRGASSVVTEPGLGVEAAAAALPEWFGAEVLDFLEGVVSDGLALRDVAALTGVVAALLDAERASGRLGEASREFQGEERRFDVCKAEREGWEVESALIVEALESSRLRREGTDALAVVSAEPVALFAVVSILKVTDG